MENIRLALLCRDGQNLTTKKQTWTVHSNELGDSLLPKDHQVWKTSRWVTNEEKIKFLINKEADLVLVMSKTSPAYLGGRILSYEKHPCGRFEISFKENPQLKGYQVADWNGSNPVKHIPKGG